MTVSNFYTERQAEKQARLVERAASTAATGEATMASATAKLDLIPFGQPVMSRRDANYRRKAREQLARGVDLRHKAALLQERVDQFGSGGIASDDPEAVAQLKAKLVELEELQATMKAANRIIKPELGKGTAHDVIVARLNDEVHPSDLWAQLLEPDFAGRVGFASYRLTNNNAKIRSTRKRIEELATIVLDDDNYHRSGTASDGTGWEMTLTEGRYRIKFDGIPDAEVRALVKGAGFRWAPSVGAWQLKVTPAAEAKAHRFVEALSEEVGA